MKQNFLIAFMIVVAKLLSAQGNLVPNPSFEDADSCPFSAGQVFMATPWIANESPDYFNVCGTSSFTVPENNAGYQFPHSGQAYCGLVTFAYTPTLSYNFREYIQVPLIDSLRSGVTYCVEFYVSVGEKVTEYISPNIGVAFTDSSIQPISWNGSYFTLGYNSQIENPPSNSLNDSIGWTLISLEFVSQGEEKWMTIGNFRNDSNTVFSYYQNVSSVYTYLFIDDISVTAKINADAGVNLNLCLGDSSILGSPITYQDVLYSWNPSNGLSDSTSPNPWAKPQVTTTYYLNISDTSGLYCNGVLSDSITITMSDCYPTTQINFPTLLKGAELFASPFLPENSTLKLFDTQGRLIFNEENYQNTFSVINLSAGIYLYQLTLSDQSILKGKFCVVK